MTQFLKASCPSGWGTLSVQRSCSAQGAHSGTPDVCRTRLSLGPQLCPRFWPIPLQTYCRIHQTIDTKLLAERLNMGIEAAERWITNLILNARLNAKIDSKAGTVVMGTQTQSVHEQLVEKSKQLSVRTFMLANTVVH
jgi:hypothetical protein